MVSIALALRCIDRVLIVSADKDFAQIVCDHVKILLPPPTANPKLGWRVLDAAGVVEKFGVPPAQIADYLALVGDTSDNIPGVNGVGPKTASKWLQQYGSLEGVIAHSAELKPERFQEAVRNQAEGLRVNLKLTTLNLTLSTVPAEKASPQPTELFRLLGELEMKGCLADAQRRYGLGRASYFRPELSPLKRERADRRNPFPLLRPTALPRSLYMCVREC